MPKVLYETIIFVSATVWNLLRLRERNYCKKGLKT